MCGLKNSVRMHRARSLSAELVIDIDIGRAPSRANAWSKPGRWCVLKARSRWYWKPRRACVRVFIYCTWDVAAGARVLELLARRHGAVVRWRMAWWRSGVVVWWRCREVVRS